MQFDVVDQTCPNSTVTAKEAVRQWSSTLVENLAQNRGLDRLAAPAIALTLRRTSLSRRGYLYEVALDGEVIVASSRDPEYDDCRELVRRGFRGIAVFKRCGALVPDLVVDLERGAQLMTKESAWGVRVVKFTLDEVGTG
jgi:hypothetical protein